MGSGQNEFATRTRSMVSQGRFPNSVPAAPGAAALLGLRRPNAAGKMALAIRPMPSRGGIVSRPVSRVFPRQSPLPGGGKILESMATRTIAAARIEAYLS